MRAILLTLAALPLAGTLAAQRSAFRGDASRPTPVQQSISFDIASAFQERWSGALEALVFGRFTIGLSGEFTTQPDEPIYGINYPDYSGCPINMLCTGAGGFDETGYKAWSFNLNARWYPAPLSFGDQRQAGGFYLGEFVGYHERKIRQPIYYGCPTCYPAPQDSTIYYPTPVGSSNFTQVLHGWEPGVELGMRLIPTRHVVIDVGGRFRLATIEDYFAGVRPGGVDSRLVVAVGIGW